MPAPNYPGQNIYLELPSVMNNIRLCPANSFWSLVDASGVVHNLKDLGIQVTAYTGGGMAPIVNQTTPYALIGGSYYQRTTPLPRPLVLICYIDAPNLRGLQILRKALISYVAPNTSTQQAAQIKLRYALTDYCGTVIGTVLEVAVNYVSGLEGNVDNLNQERFALQFIEYAPPSIKELSTNSNALGFSTGADAHIGIFKRNATTDAWALYLNITDIRQTIYDLNGDLWTVQGPDVGVGTYAVYKNTSVLSSPNATARCLAYDVSNNMYVGGNFTSPQNFIMKYNGTSFVAVGATINGAVYGLAIAQNGDLYAVGSFISPGSFVGKWNGSAWSALTGGANLNLGPARCVAVGLDGNVYIGGDFTTADGTTVNHVVKYNTTTAAYSAMPTTGTAGISGGGATVYAIVTGPDGRIYIGGDFTSAGGISAKYVAVWNGTAWQPLGTGLSDKVYSLAFDRNGILYAIGLFTTTGDGAYPLTGGVAKWNGSVWLPADIDVPVAGGLNNGVALKSDGEIALSVIRVTAASVPTTITNNGTANAIPTFVFTGPGALQQIINNTTGKAIYFNYTLLTGETATLTLDPTNLTFTSNFFGNVLRKIRPGSDLATFNLTPGSNIISCLISGTTSGATSATLQYRNTHWSFDAGVS